MNYGVLVRNVWSELFSELGTVPVVQEGGGLDLFCWSGAEFSVPAKQILHHSRSFYERLEQWLLTRSPALVETHGVPGVYKRVSFDYAAGSILELLAYSIFQGRQRLPFGTNLYIKPRMLRLKDI
jgi:hypothetical protein